MRGRERAGARGKGPVVTAGTRSLSPWWALVLLPVGLAAGWWLGAMPLPDLPPAAVTPREAAVTTAPVAARSPAAGIRVETASTPAPARVPGPAAISATVTSWTTYESALGEAKRTGKPILLDFSADWCPPCQRMKREVFDDSEHGRAVQTAVVPVAVVDRRREQGSNPSDIEALQRRYGIEAFPTLVVFSPETGRTVQTRGFGGAGRTVTWIRQAAASVR
jgi:thiol:disulfide interchange protein